MVDAAGVQAGRLQRRMFSLSAAIQTLRFCAYEFAAKAQNSSVAIERILIVRVFAGARAAT